MENINIKKITTILVLFLMILSLVACGNDSKSKSGASKAKGEPVHKAYEETKNIIDAIWTLKLSIDGKDYQLPFPLKELTDDGWEFTDSGYKLNYGKYGEQILTKGDLALLVEIRNTKDKENAIPEQEATVYGLYDAFYGPFGGGSKDLGKMPELKLPEGISLQSTLAEIKAAYGEPSAVFPVDSYKDDSDIVYRYGSHQSIQLTFIGKEDSINGFKITTMFVENFENIDGKDVDTTLFDYTAPTALSDDFNDAIIEVDGKLLQIPFPAYELMQDGWVVCHSGAMLGVNGGASLIYSYKDRAELTIWLHNFSEQKVVPEAASVREVSSTSNTLKIAGGITIGSPISDLVSVFGEENVSESGNVNLWTDSLKYEIHCEDGVVSKINLGSKR